MRKAVTYLQSCHQLCGADRCVTSVIVADIAGVVPATIMEHLWVAMAGSIFDTMKDAVADITYQGYPMSAILSQLHDDVVVHAKLSDIDKALICEKIAQVQGVVLLYLFF